MECVEIIALRAANVRCENDSLEFLRSFHGALDVIKIHGGDAGSLPAVLKVYRNAFVENDLSIHLHWQNRGSPPMKSALGLQLARLFSEYGLVNHTVWIEEQ